MRILLLLVGIYYLASGGVMLFLPEAWYTAVPGVAQTGPANIHFIRDIGLAFLAAGTALIGSVRVNSTGLLVPAAVFLGGHASLHLIELVEHGAGTLETARDVSLIVAPGLLPVIALLLSAQVNLGKRRA